MICVRTSDVLYNMCTWCTYTVESHIPAHVHSSHAHLHTSTQVTHTHTCTWTQYSPHAYRPMASLAPTTPTVMTRQPMQYMVHCAYIPTHTHIKHTYIRALKHIHTTTRHTHHHTFTTHTCYTPTPSTPTRSRTWLLQPELSRHTGCPALMCAFVICYGLEGLLVQLAQPLT